jgi:hypothetical protein
MTANSAVIMIRVLNGPLEMNGEGMINIDSFG